MQKRDNIYMRLKGIPYAASALDVQTFFRSAIVVPLEDIHIAIGIHGRPSGEAFVIFHSHSDVTKAMSKNFRNMGHRYVELVPSSLEDLNRSKKTARLSAVGKGQGIVRVHRLPYHTTECDIRTFFDGLEIVDNGVYIIYGKDGVTITDAYVEFSSEKEAVAALDRNREWNNGTRYVEVFQSSKGELLHVLNYEVAGKFAPLARHFGVDTAVSGRPTPTYVRPADLRCFYDHTTMSAQSRDGFSLAEDDYNPNCIAKLSNLPSGTTKQSLLKWMGDQKGPVVRNADGGGATSAPGGSTLGVGASFAPTHVFLVYGGKDAYCLFRTTAEAASALALDGARFGDDRVISVQSSSMKAFLRAIGSHNTSPVVCAMSHHFRAAKSEFLELVAPVPPSGLCRDVDHASGGGGGGGGGDGGSGNTPSSMAQVDLVVSLASLRHLERAGEDPSYAPTVASASSKKPSKWSRSLKNYAEVPERRKRTREVASARPGTVLHLRGLPYKATKDHVLQFFTNYDIVESSIRFGTDRDGRSTGECWVTCASQSVARQALAERNRKYICDRYVEIFLE